MAYIQRILPFVGIAALIASCDMSPKSGYGFSLPDGNGEDGKTAFIAHGCLSCHSVEGLEDERKEQLASELNIRLGGKTTRIATYGELVTSIINPSHRLARGYEKDDVSIDGVSKMLVYNDVLTVTELSDLVAFLQAQYELTDYPETTYPPYSY
ncbi:MAG: c-type cytochrome [Pseudomonadota bacterium]